VNWNILITLEKINQTRLYNKYIVNKLTNKMEDICLNKGEPSSKAKYNI
jgi:hypothetical protein